MDTAENHSARPQASLPAKLRWRPYSTGAAKAAKRQKKDDPSSQDSSSSSQQSQNQTLGLQAKALAHRVREKSFRSAKAHNPPVGVQLQWEEAETMESMSHGGHPHNQHPPLYHYQQQQRQLLQQQQQERRQLQQQQGRQRNTSDSNSDTDSDSYSTSRRLGVSSLPSPPPSKSPATPVRTQPGGDLDLSHYKARLPGLTGDDFLEHGLPLPSIEGNTVYQVALNELLENHRKNMLAEKAPALAITSATNPSNTLADSASQQPRRISSSELLGISTIEELLVSCGYSEPIGNYSGDTAIRAPVSPASTDQSLHSSPLSGIIDLQDPSSQISKTPLDISSASFDLLMAQTPVLLSEGDSKQILLQQQQQQPLAMDYSQNGLSWSTPSPFAHVAATHDDPLINGNDSSFSFAWPSLFPKVAVSTQSIAQENNTPSAAPRVDIAIQTDPTSPLSPALSGASTSTESSPMTHLGLTQEELDPDWLTFLEENSPLFPAVTESSTGQSPELSSSSTFAAAAADGSNTTPTPSFGQKSEPVTPPVREKGAWNWAEDFLKQGAMAPTGHRSFPTAGSFGSFSSRGGGSVTGGSGGMIRTLRGSSGIGGGSGGVRYQQQQRSGYHTQAAGRGSNSKRGINAASVDEPVGGEGAKKEGQAMVRIPSESTTENDNKTTVTTTTKTPKTTSSTRSEKESPGKVDDGKSWKKNSAEEESMRGGKAKAGTDSTATTAMTMTSEGFGGLLAMFRGLWKGNGGDKNGS
ncbi:hypothetical protein BG015_010305 [Linnemannia schmuckeri]|uniref:Uncharacterized protein n=1 Tax=Linnemannia schmuckeri TaxID=64567 RepID=A0A9P5V8Y2_9FUNG|nr:hypothetical protein BG015_010305 [Linnemannia schmuckeri]